MFIIKHKHMMAALDKYFDLISLISETFAFSPIK